MGIGCVHQGTEGRGTNTTVLPIAVSYLFSHATPAVTFCPTTHAEMKGVPDMAPDEAMSCT